jgi:hypothetical protein
LKEAKEANLLEPTGSDENMRVLARHRTLITTIIRACNAEIVKAVNQINAYKADLSQIDLEGLRQRINLLVMAKARYSPEVLELLSHLNLGKFWITGRNHATMPL